MNSTILIAISSSLTAVSAIAGIFFQGSNYFKGTVIFVVAVSTIITVLQAIMSQRDSDFTKRSLTNLIRSVRPSEYVRDAVFKAIGHEAQDQGMPYMHVAASAGQKYILQFRSEEQQIKPSGVLCLRPEKISEFSLYDPARMEAEVSKFCIGTFRGQTLKDCWNQIADEILLVSELIFEHHLRRTTTVKLWANADKQYIAVGPPNCPDDTLPQDRAEYPKSKLESLMTLTTLKRGSIIAENAELLLGRKLS